MRISKTDKTNFRAIHIANANNSVKGVATNFKIYRITERDSDFLDCMKAIDLGRLMPKMRATDVDTWDSVLKSGLMYARDTERKAFLLASESRPCGIIAAKKQFNKYMVESFCTFPIEPEKRLPLAGKTLIRPLFEDFLSSAQRTLELNALKYSPFSGISTYLSLGFKMCGGSDYVELMRTNKDLVRQTLKKLDSLMTYSPVMRGGGGLSEPTLPCKDLDLFNELRIDV